MHALRNRDKDIMFAFDHGMTGIFPKHDHSRGNQIMVALDDTKFHGKSLLNDILTDGLNLFENLFGYRSKTFMAPCYTWNPAIEMTLMNCGVEAIQGALRQIIPGNGSIAHRMGSKNRNGQFYFIRNCYFEPATDERSDSKRCISDIEIAFRWKKPAIISSHRLNFIGSIHRENRDKNLNQLKLLLAEIVRRWPDVEFYSSAQLLAIIKEKEQGRDYFGD
jgi:hypothetical protein